MKALKKEEQYFILAFTLQGNLIGFTGNCRLWGFVCLVGFFFVFFFPPAVKLLKFVELN